MAVLEPALRRRPHAEPHERGAPPVAATDEVACSTSQRQLPIDDGAIWLWNAQPTGLSVPVGSRLIQRSSLLFLLDPLYACSVSRVMHGRSTRSGVGRTTCT